MRNDAGTNRPLTVLMPVHNEASAIRPILDELYAVCLNKHPDFELLVLEDGSKDDTVRVLRECQASYKNMSAVIEPQRVGYREMVTRGIGMAKKEWVLLMDADGQIAPDGIWYLLDEPLSYDMVAGEKVPRCDPAHRILVSRVLDSVTDLVLGVSIRDINFGFKLMRTSVARRLAPMCGKMGEIFTAELVIRFLYAGCRFQQVRVRHRHRIAGSSQGIPPSMLIRKSWRAFTGLLRLRKELTSAPSAQTPPA